jgi:hypothetical protein
MNFLEKARTLHESIHNILINEWDPIGVNIFPQANDEYDMYIPEIYKMLIHRRPKHELFDYLWWVETERMGLKGNRQHTDRVVDDLEKLIAH